MRVLVALNLLAVLPSVGFCDTIWIPDDQGEVLPGVGIDPVTEPQPPVAKDEVPDELSADDWSSIQAAYEAGRHAVYEVEGGYQARNPGQQWNTRFDGRGFCVEPDTGGWTWGLELESYGFPGSEREVTEPEGLGVEGGRVAYDWDENLEEWYINDRRGLEHGYTVHRRPAGHQEGAESPLIFTLSVRGALQPDVAADGRGIHFVQEGGAVVLNYTGLCVYDADGRTLEAMFEKSDNRLRLAVDECGARYPLTIDPIVQQAYLKASDTDADDWFGSKVATSGDTVVVGAMWEDSGSTGVNGDDGDNSSEDSGAAYVFVRNGTRWSQQAYLKASNTDPSDDFGASLAISGDTIVIGAWHEKSNATGVNGNQGDNSAGFAGAAYVFVRSGTIWSQQAYLKASNTEVADVFGSSVTVSGNTVVIGASGEDSNATGVNGDQSDNSTRESGAAYVFVRSGTTWTQEAYLKASNPDDSDRFGMAAAVSGDTVVVGVMWEDSNATGVNGDQGDNSASKAGAAYVFMRSGTTWSQQAYLKASNTDGNDEFGISVATTGGTVVVGAHREDSNATGVNGDQSDNSASGAGAAYVFVRSGAVWSQEAYLKASNTGGYFGRSVTVSGETLVIGARGEASNATGVNGDQSDNSAPSAGAAYVFVRDGTIWSQHAYLKASNTETGDYFGESVAVSGDTVVVGAFGEDSNASGVDGNQSDNSVDDAGAAYVFDLNALTAPGVPFCFGDPGTGTPCPCNNDNDGSVPESGCANGAFASGAHLTGSGDASVSADTLVLTATHLDPSNTGLYFQANNAVNGGDGNPFGDGLRCAGGGLIRLQIRTSDASGMSSTTIAIGTKGGVSAGDTKRYQCWYRDTSGGQPCGVGVNDFNLSNGHAITWLP